MEKAVLIEKTTSILGKDTRQMPFEVIIAGLVEVIEFKDSVIEDHQQTLGDE